MAPLSAPGTISKIIVTPSVVLGVCDGYVRRGEAVDKVIGALLGTASTDANGRVVVVARASYAIPCQDRDGELLMDVEFHKTMLGLHARVNPEERVVGWFSAGAASPETTAVVHEFFAKDAVGGTPVHVMLDAEFSGVEQGGDMLSASVGETVLATTDRESGESRSAGVRFSEIECEVDLQQANKLGVESLRTGSSVKEDDDVAGLAKTMSKLGTLLADAQAYVDDVVSGRRDGDAEVGRTLSEALQSVPQLTKAQFDKVFGDSIEDVMMVQYLTNLTKMQLELSSKLHTASLLV